jgi:hypothetical protein
MAEQWISVSSILVILEDVDSIGVYCRTQCGQGLLNRLAWVLSGQKQGHCIDCPR